MRSGARQEEGRTLRAAAAVERSVARERGDPEQPPAIEKNKTAEALRKKLTARLTENATKLDDINRRAVELDSKLAELGVQFNEAIRDIHLLVPPTAP